MTSITIAHAIALPEGRQDGPGCAHRRALLAAWTMCTQWSRGWRIWFVLLVFWPVGGAIGQPAAPPDQAWQTAVDQYLAGDRSGAGAILLHATPPALFESSRRAFEQWRAVPAGDAEARRIATRRFQVSALLPLDLLIAVTGRALAAEHEVALENAAREAWQRLDAFDGEDGAQRRRRCGSSARGGAWPSSSTSSHRAASATCPGRRLPSIHPRMTPKRWPHSPCCAEWPRDACPSRRRGAHRQRQPCPCVGCPWLRAPGRC